MEAIATYLHICYFNIEELIKLSRLSKNLKNEKDKSHSINADLCFFTPISRRKAFAKAQRLA